MSKLGVCVDSFRRLRSNALLGFCDIVIPEMRLRIFDATVHQSHGKRWIGLLAKPQVTREGVVRRNERGKAAYTPVVEFTDKATRDAFSAQALKALIAAYPDAFDDDGATA
jgi:hypothetical protein